MGAKKKIDKFVESLSPEDLVEEDRMSRLRLARYVRRFNNVSNPVFRETSWMAIQVEQEWREQLGLEPIEWQ